MMMMAFLSVMIDQLPIQYAFYNKTFSFQKLKGAVNGRAVDTLRTQADLVYNVLSG
jgi:hypothetical protein